MAGTNPTRLARANYYAWRQAMDEQGIRFFWDKKRKLVIKLLSSSWTGYDGRVRAEYVIPEANTWRDDIWQGSYTYLEPLTDMEVIAHCAASGS